MFSNNNDTNNQNFEGKRNNQHDFYQLDLMGCVVVVTLTSYKEKKSCRTSSYTWCKFVMDVLNAHEIRCFEQFRIVEHMFMNLLETFTKRYGLKEVLAMPLKKALTIFLHIIGHGLINRMV